MNKLTCEMCGSNDLIKEDGCFVCQGCGTKYSVEEAKRMMVDGIVNVKVDKNSDIETIYNSAIEALNSEDFEKAKDLFKEIDKLDSKNYKAKLYYAYAVVRLSLLNDTLIERQNKFEVFNKSLDNLFDINNLLNQCESEVSTYEIELLIEDIYERIKKLQSISFTYDIWKEYSLDKKRSWQVNNKAETEKLINNSIIHLGTALANANGNVDILNKTNNNFIEDLKLVLVTGILKISSDNLSNNKVYINIFEKGFSLVSALLNGKKKQEIDGSTLYYDVINYATNYFTNWVVPIKNKRIFYASYIDMINRYLELSKKEMLSNSDTISDLDNTSEFDNYLQTSLLESVAEKIANLAYDFRIEENFRKDSEKVLKEYIDYIIQNNSDTTIGNKIENIKKQKKKEKQKTIGCLIIASIVIILLYFVLFKK